MSPARLVIAATIALLVLLISASAPANAANGSISGRVTDEASNPIAGASVNAYLLGNSLFANGLTDSDGSYTINGLEPGNYRVVAAAAGFAFEVYDDTIDFAQATPVAVTSGADTPGIDFALSAGGGISGLVTDESGSPLAGIWVEASLAQGCCSSGGASTGPDGTYTIDSLAPGSYRVFAFSSLNSAAGEFYDDTSDPNSATLVEVQDGSITASIDFALPATGTISGRVTDEAANPIAGATVDALLAAGCCAFSVATTAADGTYTIAGLPAGSYLVFASAAGYASEYFDDAKDPDLADAVSVSAGADTPNVDFALAACGSAWAIASADDDCDGYATALEEFVGTDPLRLCDDGAAPSDWPADPNGDTIADIYDVLLFKPHFLAADPSPSYSRRYDLNADGVIDIDDILVFKPFFSKSCS